VSESGPSPERRRFLGLFAVGAGVAASLSTLVPWLGLFLTPLRREDRDAWHEIGTLADFPIGETVKVAYRDPAPLPWAGYAARSAAWVRRDSVDAFSAFTTYCTHVGCAIRWEQDARLFMCPCHGGVFHEDGSVAAGPPPRPLDRFPIRVREGRVELQALGVVEQTQG